MRPRVLTPRTQQHTSVIPVFYIEMGDRDRRIPGNSLVSQAGICR